MRKYKLGKQKKFLMLTSILSIILLMSTSIAGAATSLSIADSIASESAESSDVSASLTSDSAVSDDNVEPSPSLSASSAESSPVQPPPNKPPVAIFDYTPADPIANQTITFDATDSYDPDGTIVSYYWSYTVGSSFPTPMGYGETFDYAFEKPGIYLVSLKVIDNKGGFDIMNKLVMIPDVIPIPTLALKLESQQENQAPVAIFDYTPTNPKVNETIVFDGRDSYDPDGKIDEYYWFWIDYEQGAWYHMSWGFVPVINYTFDASGSYDVLLIVIDNDDAEDSTINTVVIANATSAQSVIVEEAGFLVAESKPPNRAPVVDFSYTPTDPKVNETIIFDATDSYDPDGEIVEYWWFWIDYEQGAWHHMSEDLVPVINYSFDAAGSYDVLLIARDNKGAEASKIKTIVVVAKEAEVDQSASTELIATSEDEIISSDDDETIIQTQQTPSQQLINNILNQASPTVQNTTFGIILFNASGNGVDCLASITHFETFGMTANINLEIRSGTMHFKTLGGYVSAGPGDDVSISMFRGVFWKIPADYNSAKEGDQVTRMVGMGWFSI